MSNGNLTISVDSHENFWARARAAAQALDRGELTEPVAHFSYENLETLMSILTPKRWALMRMNRTASPMVSRLRFICWMSADSSTSTSSWIASDNRCSSKTLLQAS